MQLETIYKLLREIESKISNLELVMKYKSDEVEDIKKMVVSLLYSNESASSLYKKVYEKDNVN
jgi:hypothetical protein